MQWALLTLLLLEVAMVSVLKASAPKTEDLYIRDLPNGVKLIVHQRKDTSAVALHVWFRVGSIYERHDQKGMAHFLEHMLFNGSEKYAYGEMDQIIESLGGNINAATSKEFTFYHIEIAKPYWKKAMEVLYQLTMKPLMTMQMIEKEKPIVIEELRRGKDNPTTVLWETFEKTAYKVSPYRFPVIGFEETISRFTKESLEEFYRSYYQPKNMAVIVVGDVNPGEVESYVRRTFGKEKGKKVPKPEIPSEPDRLENRFVKISDPRIQKAYWIIGWNAPPVGKGDYYGMVVFDGIIGDGRTSVFYRELKEKGVVYSFFTGDLGRPRDNLYVISATFDPERYAEVKSKVLELLDKTYSGLSDEQVAFTREKAINSRIFEQEKVEGQAYDIGYSYTVIKDLDFFRYYEKNLSRVRKVEVMRFYERYIKDRTYVEVLMVPEKPKRKE